MDQMAAEDRHCCDILSLTAKHTCKKLSEVSGF